MSAPGLTLLLEGEGWAGTKIFVFTERRE